MTKPNSCVKSPSGGHGINDSRRVEEHQAYIMEGRDEVYLKPETEKCLNA